VGDFSAYADAEAYAQELAATYHWPILYCGGEPGRTYPREILRQPGVTPHQSVIP
jgi:hypothetical protein